MGLLGDLTAGRGTRWMRERQKIGDTHRIRVRARGKKEGHESQKKKYKSKRGKEEI